MQPRGHCCGLTQLLWPNEKMKKHNQVPTVGLLCFQPPLPSWREAMEQFCLNLELRSENFIQRVVSQSCYKILYGQQPKQGGLQWASCDSDTNSVQPLILPCVLLSRFPLGKHSFLLNPKLSSFLTGEMVNTSKYEVTKLSFAFNQPHWISQGNVN